MASHVLEKQARRAARARAEAEAKRAKARFRQMRRAGYLAIALIAAALITFAVASGGNNTVAAMTTIGGGAAGPSLGAVAPQFSLTDVVSGRQVTSASLRGHKTMLFFSEGVGCQACMVQIADLQKTGVLTKAGIQLVSITTDQPSALATAAKEYGVTTPLLADPSTTMSNEYGMLGHGGMQHPTQDGHAFMMLGANGQVLWHQAYSSMYVSPSELISDMHKAGVVS